MSRGVAARQRGDQRLWRRALFATALAWPALWVPLGGIVLLVGQIWGAVFVAVGVLGGGLALAFATRTGRTGRSAPVVQAQPAALSRGEAVRLAAPPGAGDVGLRCYEIFRQRQGGPPSAHRRATWEAWTAPGGEIVVPADVPYSYDGEVIAYEWVALARGGGGETPLRVAP